MPRFSANLGFLWPELKLADRIHAARRAGFTAVECHWPYDTPAKEVKRALDATGLVMLAINTGAGDVAQGEYGLAAVPGREADARAGFDTGLSYAKTIGAQNIHVMAGTAGDNDAVMATYLENLAYVAGAAAREGIGIIIEPINRMDRPGYTLHTVSQAIGVVERLRARAGRDSAADNVRIMFDCYHVQRSEGDLAVRLEQAFPYLVHIQVAAVPGRGEPDQGEIRYEWLYDRIDELGYTGYVGAEYIPVTTTDAGLGWYEGYRQAGSANSGSGSVFQHYTQAALDAEYNNLDKVPDSADHLKWFTDESARVRDQLPGDLNIPFAEHPDETLDVFYCNGERGGVNRPVHVFIHGGYWRALHKDDHSYVAKAFTGTDTLCVVINYALIPAIDMRELVAQCRRAMIWIWQEIEQYGGDPTRVSISGHSAGGHLVMMMLATDWPRVDYRCPADLVKRAVSLSGLSDLEPVRQCYLNKTLGLDQLAVCRNSPIKLRNRNRSELICCYGGREGPEFRRQSEALAKRWSGTSARNLALHDHFTIVREMQDPNSEVSRIVRG